MQGNRKPCMDAAYIPLTEYLDATYARL